MEFKLLEKRGDVYCFLFDGISPKFANAIRRSITEDVKTYAIEDVTIYENNSVLFDEFIAHRLGLIPIRSKVGVSEDVVFKGSLEEEGPKTVYASDLNLPPELELPFPKIPIVKLGKGQKLKLEFTIKAGTGKEHVKWQPAYVFYREVADIEIKKSCDNCNVCVEVCPKNVFSEKAGKIVVVNPIECNFCNLCVEKCPKDAIKIKPKENQIYMEIEPFGQLTFKEVLEGAIQSLKKKNEEFKKHMEKIK